MSVQSQEHDGDMQENIILNASVEEPLWKFSIWFSITSQFSILALSPRYLIMEGILSPH